jgi:hypothetical protein
MLIDNETNFVQVKCRCGSYVSQEYNCEDFFVFLCFWLRKEQALPFAEGSSVFNHDTQV